MQHQLSEDLAGLEHAVGFGGFFEGEDLEDRGIQFSFRDPAEDALLHFAEGFRVIVVDVDGVVADSVAAFAAALQDVDDLIADLDNAFRTGPL